MKRPVFLVLLLVATLFARNANAIPVGGALYVSHSATFDTGSGYVIVDCKVYEYTSNGADLYVYTYQISNQDSDIGLRFFSVGISEGTMAWSPGIDSDPISGYIDPVLWTIPDSPVQSAGHLFVDTIDSGQQSSLLSVVGDHTPHLGKGTAFAIFADTIGGGEHSALLWFVSNCKPYLDSGTVFAGNVSTTENLLTPVPEPATIALLGIGGLVMLTRKKRSN